MWRRVHPGELLWKRMPKRFCMRVESMLDQYMPRRPPVLLKQVRQWAVLFECRVCWATMHQQQVWMPDRYKRHRNQLRVVRGVQATLLPLRRECVRRQHHGLRELDLLQEGGSEMSDGR
jgi:hypothetical protein